jgi:hypothetical protein
MINGVKRSGKVKQNESSDVTFVYGKQEVILYAQ